MLYLHDSERLGKSLLYKLPEDMRKVIETEVDRQFGREQDFHHTTATTNEITCVWYTRHLAMVIGYRIATYCIEHPEQIENFGGRLTEALDLLERFQSSLNPLSTEHYEDERGDIYRKSLSAYKEDYDPKSKEDYNPKSWVWCHLDVATGLNAGPGSRHYWKSLDYYQTCFDYLSRPWMECPELEFMLVDALVYKTALDTALQYGRVSVRSKRWYTRIRVAVHLGVSLLAGVMATDNHGLGIGIPAAIGTWTMLKMLSWTSTIKTQWMANPIPLRDYELLVSQIASINVMLLDTRISPEFIRQRLLSVAELGAMWPTPLIALVERAAQRNPVSWGLSFSVRYRY